MVGRLQRTIAMADPSNDEKFHKGKEKQVIDHSLPQPGSGAAPPRSMGTHGTEFGQMADHDREGQQGQSGTGQADLGSQAATTLAGRSDQQDLGIDQPGHVGGAGEGFILQERTASDDIQERESAASANATEGSDFAPQGRGATEDEEEDSGEGHPS
jgi:hypothetical protein